MNKVLKEPHSVKKSWLIVICFFVVGIIIGLFIHVPSMQSLKKLSATPIRSHDSNYPLINSLLGYDNAEATNFGQLIGFKKKLSDMVNQEVDQNNASKISVYFRDLNTGRWVSINPEETYSPASLMKVPLMIAYFHSAETDNPNIFNKSITFNSKENIDDVQTVQPEQKLKDGQSYTTEQLINEMIVYSDNNAMELLLNNIDGNLINKLFMDMDILLPTNQGAQDFIYVKNYALFFRVLYGSTYLDHGNSEKALELLTKTTYKNGLVAGVPAGTTVAHKFGERALLDPSTNALIGNEFHDCGIVYYPENPYLLCVMTKGNDSAKLQKSISDISKLVYTEIQNKDD